MRLGNICYKSFYLCNDEGFKKTPYYDSAYDILNVKVIKEYGRLTFIIGDKKSSYENYFYLGDEPIIDDFKIGIMLDWKNKKAHIYNDKIKIICICESRCTNNFNFILEQFKKSYIKKQKLKFILDI